MFGFFIQLFCIKGTIIQNNDEAYRFLTKRFKRVALNNIQDNNNYTVFICLKLNK